MPATELASTQRTRLSVTSLSQFVRFDNCERFLRLRLRPDEEKRLLRRWDLTIQPLTALLRDSGAEFELAVTERLASEGEEIIDLLEQDASVTISTLTSVRRSAILLQPDVEAQLGGYALHGRADAVRVERDRKGALHFLVGDIKASRHERMEHRLQVAAYARLLRSMAEGAGQVVSSLQGTIVTLESANRAGLLTHPTDLFDLATYEQIVDHLLVAPDSVAARIANTPFEDIFYHLGYKCDGCLYNAICMYDSAERLDLSLTPLLTGVEKRVLLENGVRSLPELAALLTPTDGNLRQLAPTSGREELVTRLSGQWPVGPRLLTIAQRARSAYRRFDKSCSASSYLSDAPFGTLPADDEHPGLIKIFFDAQRDYLLDRVYLISALVRGPKGEQTVVRCADAPPTETSEAELLLAWLHDALRALTAVSGGPTAPIHLYCYNRYDQRVLLESLKRHMAQIALLPGFYDLMTQHPALEQPIISFLADELAERRVLGRVCAPLHDAARMMGFDWRDERFEYFRLFRTRMFDNQRTVRRSTDGRLVALAGEERNQDGALNIESASRFNSQIPLEYAYAVWGCLPESEDDRDQLKHVREVTREELLGFAAHRVAALAAIEASFKVKAGFLNKPPFNLAALTAAQPVALAESLKQFLHIEHHAAFQAKLQTYALPIDRRAQTGLALPLRYGGQVMGKDTYRFLVDAESIRADRALLMNAFRPKEGDWMVLNPSPLPPRGQIKNGRLAVIQRVEKDALVLRLMTLFSARGSKFKYYHDNGITPVAGGRYTIDQMADDFNGDKALDALTYADRTAFYRWLLQRPGPRPVRPEVERTFAQVGAWVDSMEQPRKLTRAQREVIAQHLADPLFLVQGPPGTGKSHTLAWAVLARVAAETTGGRPFAVGVACKTHNAVNIVLREVATRLRRAKTFLTPATIGLGSLLVCKVAREDDEDAPPGVQLLDAYKAGPEGLERLLTYQPVVIGGTPGGLHSIAKYRLAGGKGQIAWDQPPFDLLVIDEASQMSLPEAVLAGAFLKPGGQCIVVGDHRQMPPIIAHPWDDEQKRMAEAHRPHLSLFESLLARGFPRVALDESFRLHELIAEFLGANIYAADDIRFFSRRTDLLDPVASDDPLVRTALDPAFPIVVVEHDEARSQQRNETEIELVAPIIEACVAGLGLNGREGVGVVVPHRAQKARLRDRFPALAQADSIDTVERFQGGERDVIIVSATASDPDYVLAEASFLLNLNRLNVALSRPRKKLIVVASRSVVDLLVSDLKVFDQAVIWKRLFHQFAGDVLLECERAGAKVRVRGRRCK